MSSAICRRAPDVVPITCSPWLYHRVESTGGIDGSPDSGKDSSSRNISVVQENIFASKLELYESDLYDVMFAGSTVLFTY